MKKSFAPAPIHWWDWTSVALLIVLLQALATRLVATQWTPHLGLMRGFAWMGATVGLALGYSVISQRKARWLSFFYMATLLPLQWTTVIEGSVALDEKLVSVGGRIIFSISELASSRPVEDPLFFIALMSIVFWTISASAAYQLTRRQNFIRAILPSFVGILIIQYYDNALNARMWLLAFFMLLALLLLGRLNFLSEQKRWQANDIFLSPESRSDLYSGLIIAAGALIVIAWLAPPSLMKIETARRVWNQISKPWAEFTDRFENAVSALKSQIGGAPNPEFYGSQLELGTSFPISEELMFVVAAPDLPTGAKPPRYYWRGRVYDQFVNGEWKISAAHNESFSSETPPTQLTDGAIAARFGFQIGEQPISLLFAPANTIWISRPGAAAHAPNQADADVLSWSASSVLLPGETYQTVTSLSNPNIEELRTAGIEYPQWARDRYLQLPKGFSSRIANLAQEITAEAETPYDKTVSITRYLRDNIRYAPTIPDPPFAADPLEWILFKHKQAFCVYYASLEVVMLRSVGIPARLAVGFAEGETVYRNRALREDDQPQVSYRVRKANAHAWPEVYFPNIGWVEFEPTGNQTPLERPHAPRDSEPILGLAPSALAIPDFELDDPSEMKLLETGLNLSVAQAQRRSFIIAALLLAVIALTVYLSRRYALPTHVPSLIRASIERGGMESPVWVINWERWTNLSSIERSFESVNAALRWLKQTPPIHATPAERARQLAELLPDTAPLIKLLLDEHQISLYTPRSADVKKARKAARRIRFQAALVCLHLMHITHPDSP